MSGAGDGGFGVAAVRVAVADVAADGPGTVAGAGCSRRRPARVLGLLGATPTPPGEAEQTRDDEQAGARLGDRLTDEKTSGLSPVPAVTRQILVQERVVRKCRFSQIALVLKERIGSRCRVT